MSANGTASRRMSRSRNVSLRGAGNSGGLQMSRRILGTFVVALLSITQAAAAVVPPSLTLVQGSTSTPCGLKVRILVNPNGATLDVSQFAVRYNSSCLTFVAADLGADAPASTPVPLTNDLAGSTSFPI